MAESVDKLLCKRKLVLYSTNESNEEEFADSGVEYIPSEEDNSSNSDVNETLKLSGTSDYTCQEDNEDDIMDIE